MHALVPLLFFFAQPFWQARPPEDWTLKEIGILRSMSPWAQTVGPAPPVLVYFATAAPIEEAESELRVRSKSPMREPDPDYAAYITGHRDQNFVVAIPYANLAKLGKAEEERRLEEETVMLIGKTRRHKMVGHFPPTPSDPILRLIFPREVRPTDKTVIIRFSLPGIDFPDREVEFQVKDLMYRGKLEM
jgi:hypothetical protein